MSTLDTAKVTSALSEWHWLYIRYIGVPVSVDSSTELAEELLSWTTTAGLN